MKSRFLVSLAAAAAACAVAPASAAVTYDISGVFKPSDGASFRTLLGGGSFDGSFVLAQDTFPTSGAPSFVSYSINIRDAAGAILSVLAQSPGQSGGYIDTSVSSTYGGTRINFYELQNGITQKSLFLIVPNGFNGTGGLAAGTTSTSYLRVPSGSTTVKQEAFVTSATIAPRIVTAVPEPATWGLMLIGFGVAGAALRSRRVRFNVARPQL